MFTNRSRVLLASWLSTLLVLFCAQAKSIELNIATVNNGHMIEMEKLTSEFEREHPWIKLKWHVYNEGSLRIRAIADIAAKTAKYDVVTIGMYEAPIWAKRGWLTKLELGDKYQVDDIIPSIRNGLSYNNQLYAAPFYGESSILMYRKDILNQHGITLDERPSWEEIQAIAKKVHNPNQSLYGICLRGKPGWGDNMALVTTIANSFGARWFDMNWQPEVNSEAWHSAVNFYVDLLTNYGPPTPHKKSFNELLQLSMEGKCAMWIDASVAASFITNRNKSEVADQWAFAQTPYQTTTKGANWLWAWSLAIPSGTKKVKAAQTFVNWATSKEYIELVAAKSGWGSVPTGTRKSTYSNANFLAYSKAFATAELEALRLATPEDSTLPPSPYVGIQFVPINEFVSIAGLTGIKVSEALQGKLSVTQALNSSQKFASREMRRSKDR